MGVIGLWRILGPGTPIDPAELRGQCLSVDLSIWLHRAVHGSRGSSDASRRAQALSSLFKRVCALLAMGKPIFVFDGSPPQIKAETQKKRRERRAQAEKDKTNARKNLMSNVLKLHAMKTVTDEIVSQKDIDKVMRKLEAARDDEPDDFGFVSSDYKKPEIVQSSESEEEDEFEEQEMGAFQLSVRDNILSELVETGKVDTNSKAFQSLRYSDQLGILDEVRDSFKFDRSYLTGQIHAKSKAESSQKSQEEQDKEFSKYQIDGLLSKNNIRKEIRKVEDESKKNNLRDIIENSQGKLRKAGKKYALFEQEEEAPKEKIAKSIFDFEEKKELQTGTLSESSSEDEFVSDDSEYEVTTEETIKVPIARKQNILGFDTSVGEIESSSTSDIIDIEIPDSILKMARLAAQKRQDAAKLEADFKNRILESSDSSDVQFVHGGKVRNAETLKGDDATPQMPLCALRRFLDESENHIDITDSHKFSEIDDKATIQSIRPPDNENIKQGSPEIPFSQQLKEENKLEEDVLEEKYGHDQRPKVEAGDEIKEENIESSPKTPVYEQQCTEKDEHVSNVESEEPLPTFFNGFIDEVWELLLMEMTEEQVELSIQEVNCEKLQEREVIDESWSTLIREIVVDVASIALQEEQKNRRSSSSALSPIEEFTAASVLKENAVQLQKLDSALKLTAIPSKQLYKDAAEMLTLFGCGVFFAPGEAEAQCAEFEMINITQGTITDDGDTFLFGGKIVIKGLTLGNMVPVKYDIEETEFSREFLIALAQLTGSDYCNGIKSVGSKTAMKILEEFDDRRSEDPHLTLNTFSKWWKTHHKSLTTGTNGIPLRAKLKKLHIEDDFPSDRSRHAYLHPNVEKLKDKKIRFAPPDLERIRKFAVQKLDWQEQTVDQHIIPLLPEKIEKRKDIRFYMNAKK